jgi:hypothetical protein
MKITDLLIIYFSAGAPVAVYFYFQNRDRLNLKKLRLKTLLTFFFWLPSTFELLLRNKFFQNVFFLKRNKNPFFSNKQEKKLYEFQKQLENTLQENNPGISIFELRETLDRYVGLTLAARTETSVETSKELFRAAENKNVELAAKCLYRRNRQRLFFHQTSARQDFLHVIKTLFLNTYDKKNFVVLTCEFVKALQDFEARRSLEKLFAEKSSNDKRLSFKISEKDLWKHETRKPLSAKSISTLTQTISATNLPKKD